MCSCTTSHLSFIIVIILARQHKVTKLIVTVSELNVLASEFLSIHPAPEESEDAPPPPKKRNKVSFCSKCCNQSVYKGKGKGRVLAIALLI